MTQRKTGESREVEIEDAEESHIVPRTQNNYSKFVTSKLQRQPSCDRPS